ncbi:MAG: DUF1653 domain-containing protein [Clostridia bacterium]|nr:DUF1653 domain-containing protein [Clostridia bacterium]
MGNEVLERRPYRHFKGKLDYVHAVTEHTETREMYVSYQALYPPYGMYLRNLDDFTAEIDINREGNVTHQSRRFELYDGKMDIVKLQ